jgi:hypothetical protein
MQHPLDGARLKVIRAQEHLDALKAEIAIYLEEQPHEVRSQPARHPYHAGLAGSYPAYYAASPLHELPIIVPGEPPLRLSTIIGDVVTNARAALDYIVWELTQRYFNPPFDITDYNDRRITAFPIDPKSKGRPLQAHLDALQKRGIPADPINEIQAVLLDNAPDKPLGWLHELVNRDKHRMPLLTVGHYDEMTVTFTTPAIYADISGPTSSIVMPREPITGEPPALQADVQMKAEVAIYLAWKDVPMPREPVERTLVQIVKTVANIIPQFDTFLA